MIPHALRACLNILRAWFGMCGWLNARMGRMEWQRQCGGIRRQTWWHTALQHSSVGMNGRDAVDSKGTSTWCTGGTATSACDAEALDCPRLIAWCLLAGERRRRQRA